MLYLFLKGGNMRKVPSFGVLISFLIVPVLLTEVVVWADWPEIWTKLPEGGKVQFGAETVRGEADFWIYAVVFTADTIPILASGNLEVEKAFMSLLETLHKHYPNRLVLFVKISNWSWVEYFFPTNFVFTQFRRQYQVTYADILPLDKGFLGGRMAPNVMLLGFIVVPEGIDTSQPFTLRYGYGKGVFNLRKVQGEK